MGFRQDYVEYDKQPRTSGRSGWTTAKKIKLVVDSVTGFSDAPIRWCSLAGAAFVVIAVLVLAAGVGLWPGLGAAVVVLLGALVGLSGIQLLAIGVIGEYVWRSLDESRRRPSYIVEAATDDVASIPV
jgi:dolichol-phosphate mannosyltransferase